MVNLRTLFKKTWFTITLAKMNTSQITHALEQDPITSQKFCGVFSSNNLPQTIDKYAEETFVWPVWKCLKNSVGFEILPCNGNSN